MKCNIEELIIANVMIHHLYQKSMLIHLLKLELNLMLHPNLSKLLSLIISLSKKVYLFFFPGI